MTIDNFKDEYAFLSNFYEKEVFIDFIPAFGGKLVSVPTNEHAFQACKTDDFNAAKLIIEAADASTAKKLGRQVKLNSNWEDNKIDYMEKICTCKFNQHIDMKMKLLLTGGRPLVEGNTWKDEFWGVSRRTGNGENHLGKILMSVRSSIYANDGNVVDVLESYLSGNGLGFIAEKISLLYKEAESSNLVYSFDPDQEIENDD